MSKKDILDLEKHVDTRVRVKFSGGREVTGILKGHDPLVNLVLFDAVEYMAESTDGGEPVTRKLGVVVCRGPAVTFVCPENGFAEVSNPFLEEEEPEAE